MSPYSIQSTPTSLDSDGWWMIINDRRIPVRKCRRTGRWLIDWHRWKMFN